MTGDSATDRGRPDLPDPDLALAAVTTHDVTISGPAGPIACRVYRRPPEAVHDALIWIHGGGFIAGDLEMPEADWVARWLAASGTPVLCVDYRKTLAGVHYPAPADDVLVAWQWATDHAPELNSEPSRLHLGGASAGALLAAGLAQRLRDGAGPPPKTVILVYGFFHPRLPAGHVDLLAPPGGPFMITAAMIHDLALNYAGSESPDDSYSFPGHGELAGLPPTYLLNCEIDNLRSSADAYAVGLVSAGVTVVTEVETGAGHGHLNERGSAVGVRSLHRIQRWLHQHSA